MARTLDEQTQSLANYLPTGRVWAAKNLQDSVTRATLAGFSGELLRNEALIEEFKYELIPDHTTLFINEWERAVGIPDDCFTGVGTVEERRNDVLAKLASLGVQTAEDMRLLALQIYGIEITVTTPEASSTDIFPYTFPISFGISEREARFTLIINYDNLPAALMFPYTFPIPLLSREIGIIECLLKKVKPANVGFYTQSVVPPPTPPVFEAGDHSVYFNLLEPGSQLLEYQLAEGAPSDFEMGSDFTIGAWLYPRDGSPNAVQLACGLGNGATDNRYQIGHSSTTGFYYAHLWDKAHGKNKTYRFGSLSFNAWVFVTLTWNNSTGTLKVYEDGTEDTTPVKVIDDTGMNFNTPSFWNMYANLGANGNSGGGEGYHGYIYQLMHWDTVLSGSEISAVYNGKNVVNLNLLSNFGAYASAGNLKHWWWVGAQDDPNLGIDHGLSPIDITNVYYTFNQPTRVASYPTP